MKRIVVMFVVSAVLALSGTVAASDTEERLVDLLASDQIHRIDFQADTYEGAMTLIETSVETMLSESATTLGPPEKSAEILQQVIEALDAFKPRSAGWSPGDLDLAVMSDADARRLGSLIVNASSLVFEEGAGPASARSSADALFRSVVLDMEEGTSFLEQLDEHVRSVQAMPPDKRQIFLR